jgi:hypothetical protein
MAENSVKVSEITVQDIADFLRLSEQNEEDTNFLKKCLEIAKSYIRNYTGVEDLDSQADFVICVFLLCQDMYDNRTIYSDKTTPNKTFETILNLHCKNLL